MSSSVRLLLDELKSKKLYSEEALDYCKDKGVKLSREDSFELIEEITKEADIFPWLNLVGYLLRKTAAADNRFLEILFGVMQKTKGDWPQFSPVRDLVQIGFDQTELALQIYKKAKDVKKVGLFFACRWIVGGVCKKDFQLVQEDIRDDLKSPNSELRTSALTVIRIAFSEGMSSDWAKEVFPLLNEAREDQDQTVKMELLTTYLTFYEYAKEICFSSIVELSMQNTELKRLASNLLFRQDVSKPHRSTLLRIMAVSDDKTVLKNALSSIYKTAKLEDIKIDLEVIHNLLKRFSYFELKTFMDLALNKMGDVDLETCLTNLYSWAKEKNTRIQFDAPWIAVEFARNNTGKLVDSLISVMDTNEALFFAFDTSRVLLTEIYERSSKGTNLSESDKKIVNNLLEKLKNLARNKGLDSDGISSREQLIIFKCTILMEVLQNDRPAIDYDIICRNLDSFPNIKQFVGEKWFKRMEREQNKTHPLLVYLSDKLLDEREFECKLKEIDSLEKTAKEIAKFRLSDAQRANALLEHLENAIDVVKARPGLKTVKASLRHEEPFWKVISEIDVMSRLMKGGYHVEISPNLEIREGKEVKVKKPDLRVMLECSDIYIEVISPDMFAPLRYFHLATTPNRVRGKITEEIEKHFKGMEIEKDVIIIIDFGDSEIRYSNIQDYVEGELQFILRTSRVKGEVIGIFKQRGEPMTKMDLDTRIVIGIIGYARVVGRDGKIHLKGKKFPSDPQASTKLKILEIITKTLLG